MDKTQGMADLMGDGIRCVLFVAHASLDRENTGRWVSTIRGAEGAQRGNTANGTTATNSHPYAPGGIGTTASNQAIQGRFLGGDIDVKGAEVFGNPLPDVLNSLQFKVTKGSRVIVYVKDRANITKCISVTVEVKINGVIGFRQTV